MQALTKPRIESIDLLKGLVMVIMALDHVRDYFHWSAFYFDPADPVKSTLPIFFTRWITHFCAPAFSFLAGISAYMVGKRKTKRELSAFLLKRGVWLILIEFTVVCFAWFFDIQFRTIIMAVIWSLGISMVVLAALIHLKRSQILIVSLLIIFGHNLLDTIHFPGNLLWTIFHERGAYALTEHMQLRIGYPMIPWIAVMSLGYYFGGFYDNTITKEKRRQLFNILGASSIAFFILIRWSNLYGNPVPFVRYELFSQNIISFLNPAKYPPSLQYLLMTLGGVFLFLANSENWKGKVMQFFQTFGRVPFFYYILHLYFIHLLAMLFAAITGFGWKKMILYTLIFKMPEMKGYGFPLWVVYLVWAGLIVMLYPLCKAFDRYKQKHKEKWWLSYL